jgi:uncharacterized membrane protein
MMVALHTLLAFTYPVLFYFALEVASPRVVALCGLALLALRLALVAPARLVTLARIAKLPALAFAGATLASALWNDAATLLLTPALVSFSLLLAFGLSFRGPETVIEAIARAQVGTLGPEERSYCRKVTALWCAFFLGNGAVASQLALAGSREAWALYTGCIAYVLLGLLFASEFVYRHWRFRRYVGAPTDPLFRRIFPPNPP